MTCFTRNLAKSLVPVALPLIFTVQAFGSWTAPDTIDRGEYAAAAPRLAVNKTTNEAIAVFVQNESGIDRVFAAKYNPLTGWEAPVAISPAGQPSMDPHIVNIGGNNYIAAFISNVSSLDRVYTAKFTSGVWNSATQRDNAGYSSHSPRLASSGSKALLAWIQNDASGWGQVYTREFNGASWESLFGPHNSISGGLEDCFDLAIAYHFGGPAALVYSQYNSSATVNQLFGRYFNGSAWDARVQLDTCTLNLSNADAPAVRFDGFGNAMVIFNQNHAVYWTKCTSGAWNPPGILDSTESVNQNLRLAYSGNGNTFIASYALASGSRPVYASRFGGVSWITPELISTGGGSAIEVDCRLACDTITGRARVIWYEEKSGARRMHSRYFDGAAWQTAEILDHENGNSSGEPALAWTGMHYLALFSQAKNVAPRIMHSVAYHQKTWDNYAATGDWNDARNWFPKEAPKPGDSLVFDGTSSANCTIGESDTVRTLYFDPGYSGAFTFGANCSLFVTGNANFMNCGTINGTGALCFTGADPHSLIAGAQPFPSLINAGSGTLTSSAGDITVDTLIAAAGTIDLSSISIGTVNGNVNIQSGATLLAPSMLQVGGSWENSGTFTHNNGSVQFNGSTTGQTITTGGSPLYGITFGGSGGEWTLQDNLSATDLYLHGGAINLGTGLSHAVTNIYTSSMWAATLDFGSATVTATGDVNLEALGGLNASNGTLVFAGTTQSFTPYGSALLPPIAVTSGATTTQMNMHVSAIRVSAGSLDLTNATPLTIQDSMDISNGGSVTAPAACTIGGSFVVESGCAFNHASGAITFDGSASDSKIATGGNQLYAVTINGAAGAAWTCVDHLAIQNALNVAQGTLSDGALAVTLSAGSLSVTGGALEFSSGALDINGAVSQSAGTFHAPADTLFVGDGQFAVSGGTFNHHNGTIVFDNTTGMNIDASQPLYNIVVNSAMSGRYLDADLTIEGDLTCVASGLSTGMHSLTVQKDVILDGGEFSGGSAPVVIGGSVTGNAGSLTGPSDTLWVGGDWTFTGASYSHNYGAVAFNGSSSGNIIAANGEMFDKLVIQGSGDWTTDGRLSAESSVAVIAGALNLSTDTLITGSLTISGGSCEAIDSRIESSWGFSLSNGAFSAPASDTMFVGEGAFDVTGGSFAHNSGVIVFTNPMGSQISCSQPLHTVEMRTSSGGRYLSADLSVAGDLILTTGPFSLGSYNLAVGGNCIVQGGQLSASSSNLYISGSLEMSSGSIDPPGSGYDFHIGGLNITGGTYTENYGIMVFAGSNIAMINPGGTIISTVRIAGQGAWTMTGALSTELLVLDSGTLALGNGLSHGVLDIKANGGMLDFGGSALIVEGSPVDLDSLEGVTSAGGRLELNGMSSQIFRPANGMRFPHIRKIGASSLTIEGCGLTADSVTLVDGAWDWGSNGFGHVVYGPIRCTGGSMSFGTSSVHAGGDVDLAAATISSTSATLIFMGDATQQFTPNASANPSIDHSGTGTLKLRANLQTPSFIQSAGTLDLSGSQLVAAGDLSITNGGASSLAGLEGATIAAGGAVTLSGQSSDPLNLNPASTWYLNASNTATVSYATVANGDASAGTMPYVTSCTDQGGNVNWDFSAPHALLESPSADSYMTSLTTVSGTADDGSGSGIARVELRIMRDSDSTCWDGGAWSNNTIWLTTSGNDSWSFSVAASWSDGSYTLYARAADNVGNIQTSPATRNFFIDATPPVATISSPAEGLYRSPGSFAGTATDNQGCGVYRVVTSIHRQADNRFWDGGQWSKTQDWLPASGAASWSFDLSATSWENGDYVFLARAEDSLGNAQATPAAAAIRIDSTAPALVLRSPADSQTSGSGQVTYSLTENVYSGSVEWQWQTGALDSTVHRLPLAGTQLSAGEHTADIPKGQTLVHGATYNIILHATDSAGNQASATATQIIIDAEALRAVIESPPDSSSFKDFIPVSFTLAEPAASGSVALHFIALDNAADPHAPHTLILSPELESAQTHSLSIPVLDLSNAAGVASVSSQTADALVEGAAYQVALSYTDAAGNASTPDTVTAVRYDATAPSLSVTQPTANTAVNSTELAFSVTEKLHACSIVWEWIDGVADPRSPHEIRLDKTLLSAGEHTFAPHPDSVLLTNGAIYRVIFTAADRAGNMVDDTIRGVSFDQLAPAPVLSSPAPGDTLNDSIPFVFTLPEDAEQHSVTVTIVEDGTQRDPGAPHTVTFDSTARTAGEHRVLVYGSAPGSSPGVYAVSPRALLVDSALYTLALTYRDLPGNASDTATVSGVLYRKPLSPIFQRDTTAHEAGPHAKLTLLDDTTFQVQYDAAITAGDIPATIITWRKHESLAGDDSVRTKRAWIAYRDTTYQLRAGKRGRWIFAAALVDTAGNVSPFTFDTISAPNRKPRLSLADSATVNEDSRWRMPVLAHDYDGDALSISLVSGPDGAAINATMDSLGWTPGNQDVGMRRLFLAACDSFGGCDTASVWIDVVNVNDNPAVRIINLPDTVPEDTALTATLIGFDPDSGDTLRVRIESPQWLSASAGSFTGKEWRFTLHGVPRDNHTGQTAVKATIFDAHGGAATAAETLFVLDLNDAPETEIALRRIAGGAVRYRIEATDDFDSLPAVHGTMRRLDTDEKPRTLAKKGGEFQVYPLTDGRYAFEFYAKDSKGAVDSTPAVDTIAISGASNATFADTGVWFTFSAPGGAKLDSSESYTISHWDESRPRRDVYQYYAPSREISVLRKGHGYWGKIHAPWRIEAERAPDSAVALSLVSAADSLGWNQIASPYPYPVKWPLAGPLWKWNGKRRDFEESSDQVLAPWEAYWYRTDATKTVTLKPEPWFGARAVAKRAAPRFVDRHEWRIRLSLVGSGGQDSENLIGFSKRASNGVDTLDRLEPPRMVGFPCLYSVRTDPRNGALRMASDIRRKETGGCGIFNIGVVTGVNSEAAVSLSGISELRGVYAWLYLENELISLGSDTILNLPSSEKDRYFTIFTSANRNLGRTLPLNFRSALPYPNPFAPNCHLQYTLPYRWDAGAGISDTRYRVMMSIYDVKGRRVRNLVNRRQGPGHYHVVWDGKTNTGRQTAVGNYLCILQAGEFRAVHRLMLMK